MRRDRFDHAIEIVVNFVIPEAQYAPAVRGKPSVATVVARDFRIGRMRRAVDFDDETRCVAEEIRNIKPAWRLASELQSDQAMRA